MLDASRRIVFWVPFTCVSQYFQAWFKYINRNVLFYEVIINEGAFKEGILLKLCLFVCFSKHTVSVCLSLHEHLFILLSWKSTFKLGKCWSAHSVTQTLVPHNYISHLKSTKFFEVTM